MKTAIVVIDGAAQLVLTPETDWERKALSVFPERPGSLGRPAPMLEAVVHRGTFYACQGGWMRFGDQGRDDESVIIRFAPARPDGAP